MLKKLVMYLYRTCAEATRAGRNPTRRLSKTNNVDNKNKKKHKKLCSISPTKQFRRQENNLSKKPSNTNTTNNYK